MDNILKSSSLWKWRSFAVPADLDFEKEGVLPSGDELCLPSGEICKGISFTFPEEGLLDLYSIDSICYQEGKKFWISGEFTAQEEGRFFAGCAADGRFLLRMNGNIVLDGRQAGNNEFPLQTNSHILELDHCKGNNLLFWEIPSYDRKSLRIAVKIMEGMKSLAFRYGPYLTFPDSSENAISIVFAGTRNSPGAVDFRKKGSSDPWERIYDNLGGQRRRDRAVHHIRLSELQGDRTYEYRCVLQNDCRDLEEIFSELSEFYIPSPDEKNFSFILTADLQHAGLRIDFLEDLLGKDPGKKADFFVMGGDIFWTSNYDLSVMDEFMEPYRRITDGKLPLVMVRGNHEYYGKESNRYFEYFTPPWNLGREGYYMFRRGEVCFIVLDFCDDDDWMPPSSTRQFHDFEPYLKEEKKWLQKAVESPVCQDAKYRIILAHGVPLGDANDYMPSHIREMIEPLFTGNDPVVRIHLYLGGHVHRPFRSIPESRNCYAVLDPASFNTDSTPPYTGEQYSFPVIVTGGPNGKLTDHFQFTAICVDVSEQGLLVRHMDRYGKEFDRFTIGENGCVTDQERSREFRLFSVEKEI